MNEYERICRFAAEYSINAKKVKHIIARYSRTRIFIKTNG